MSKGVDNLVIIESPGKRNTIEKILGKDFVVKASFGHVTDLPKNKLGFDAENNFEPEFNVTKDKFKVVRELKSLIGPNTTVWLATDDDREGESIAMHLEKVLKLKDYKRIVFHEITKPAILEAMKHPRKIDYNLADAATARRVLDRIVGYILSPLLWTKIKYGLSAGRVQSAAVRIIADRDKEINAFIPEEYWKLKLAILSKPEFNAELAKVNSKKANIKNEQEATLIKKDCDSSDYVLDDILEKETKRTPPPPFITSSLQQAASSNLNMSPKVTMSTAQKLYEGQMRIPGHTGGLITYMRTDSTNLSNTALQAAKEFILKTFGNDYVLQEPRRYGKKAKGAQEAHEAIRPSNIGLTPDMVKPYLDAYEFKLYDLIWKRTVATQMQQAKVANTTYKILGGKDKNYEFVAKGTKILFPGYLKVYNSGSDDGTANNNQDKFLPNVPKGTIFKETNLVTEQHFTKPPSRYNEATLIKKLETEGIGRPSTYATTITSIMNRGYVEKTDDKKLATTGIGMVVNDYLVENFPKIVDLKFTAKIEEEFDEVAEGKKKWQEVIKDFYTGFITTVNEKSDGERVNYSEHKEVGVDPNTGITIYRRMGRFGEYVQLGKKEEDSKEKLPVASIPKGMRAEDITVDQALKLLAYPKLLGKTKEGYEVKVNKGRFGPHIVCNGKYYSLGKDDTDIEEIQLQEALEIIKRIDEKRAKAIVQRFDKDNITVLEGPWGYYIKQDKKNYKIPKNLTREDLEKLSLEEVKELIKNAPAKGKNNGKRRKK